MARVKIRSGRQITIPAAIAQCLHLNEGDFIEVGALFGSAIIMLPSKKLKKNHQWLSEKLWELMEEEAEEDIKAGRVVGPFKSVAELMRDLRS
jgi:AbrB family looped-hinge helix DNA binding protein